MNQLKPVLHNVRAAAIPGVKKATLGSVVVEQLFASEHCCE